MYVLLLEPGTVKSLAYRLRPYGYQVGTYCCDINIIKMCGNKRVVLAGFTITINLCNLTRYIIIFYVFIVGKFRKTCTFLHGNRLKNFQCKICIHFMSSLVGQVNAQDPDMCGCEYGDNLFVPYQNQRDNSNTMMFVLSYLGA